MKAKVQNSKKPSRRSKQLPTNVRGLATYAGIKVKTTDDKNLVKRLPKLLPLIDMEERDMELLAGLVKDYGLYGVLENIRIYAIPRIIFDQFTEFVSQNYGMTSDAGMNYLKMLAQPQVPNQFRQECFEGLKFLLAAKKKLRKRQYI